MVRTILPLPDGKILVLGNQGSTNFLIRLHLDGSLDASFQVAVQRPSWGGIYHSDLLVQPDSKILVGGSFTSLQGHARKYLACLQSGGLWPNDFNARLDVNARVRALALQPDGKVVVGGDFTEINCIRRNRVARLYYDGTLDQSFEPGEGPNGPVTSLVVQAENKVVITGTFTQVNGHECAGWARLMGDGASEAVEGPWLSCRRHDGAFEIGWRGAVDRLVTLGVSTNLVHWQIWTNVMGSASSQWLPEPPEFHAVRCYYRASLEAS